MKSLVKRFMLLALIVLGAAGVWAQTNNTIDLSTVTSDITVNNGYTLTGTLGANVQISIANGATVTLNNVTINGVDNSSYNWAGITCNGNATLILVGENTVKGFYSYRSGIYVPENSTLTIQGSGSLTASSNGNGVGIGGNKSGSGGNIIIAGGTITATGGNECAGIGGGQGGSCGNISITSGIVIATGGNSASGIGGGKGGSCGNISITGGTVTATGGNSAPGIGGGGSSCNINISGGMVTATGGNSAPGIGGKQSGGCGTITIANTVTGVRAVKGGNSPHSIGAGQGGGCGTVTVNGNVSDGISTSPYSYPSYTLDDIPTGWTVRADNQTVSVTDGVASIPVGATVVLTPPTPDKPRVKDVELLSPEEIPLTFEAMVAGAKVKFTLRSEVVTDLVEYSTDGITWSTYTSDTYIPLDNVGDKVSFRGNNAAYAESSEGDEESHFSCSADCYVYGNVMSLIDPIYFATITELTSDFTFCSLFNNNSHIYNHPTKTLELPALTLSHMCYYGMFKGCTNLTTAPDLHATELDNWCYAHMFEGCTSLTTAPALPATTMKEDCYTSMFLGCTSLEIAPELPATELYGWCYSNMFSGCTSLTTAPELPATSLQQNCYQYMFKGCTNLTTAPELPAGTLVDECYLHMFDSCTSLVTVPDLPATTLDVRCYSSMFSGCSSLTTPPTLPATTLVDGCYYSMFSGCSSLTTAPMLPAETLVEYCYSHMFDSCKLLNHVTCLATDISASNCTANWLNKVAATGTFYKPTSVDWGTPGSSTIPVGWTAKDVMYATPLTFEAKEANATVTFTINANAATNGVEYSTDGTTWNTYTSGSPISLTNAGDKVSFRGNNATYATYNNDYIYSYFSCSADCYIYGNIMSLINEDNFANTTILTKNYTFYKLFENNDKIYYHGSKPLLLPATTLRNGCYWGMFSHCTQLTKAPALPATTLENFCYAYMFEGCTKLETAPALPATTLANNCYSFMFDGCTQLTTAPVLPATTLTVSCYRYMFNNCSHLNNVTCLATDISADDCTTYWLSNVAATGTFNKAASMTTWPTGPYDGNVDGIPTGWTVVTYETVLPLTFEAKTAGATVTFGIVTPLGLEPANVNIEYSLNDGAWTAYSNPITLTNVGDKVSFRGDNATYYYEYKNNHFSCSDDCYIYGNIMSLVNSTNFTTTTTLTEGYAFNSLFKGNDKIYNHASKMLVLPATTLRQSCYAYMFRGCTSLTVAPALPAEALANNCYQNMFEGCTNLTAAPNLPATNLFQSCYAEMFKGCTSLTTAPNLPATSLASTCYANMFNGCTNLLTIPTSLPATTLQEYCYMGMFEDCTSLTMAPLLPATTMKMLCYDGMFSGCTSLATAPTLPATTLAHQCYAFMFSGCTSLTTAPELPATTLSNFCYNRMFGDCSSLTSAPKLPATTLADGCYQAMFQGCTSLTTAPTLPATTLTLQSYWKMFNGCTNLNKVTCLATSITATNCTEEWLDGVASSGTFYKDPSMTSWTTGASGIPFGWTVDDDPLSTPLTFEAITAGATVTFTEVSHFLELNKLDYNVYDGNGWQTYTSGTPITLANVGDKVSFLGTNAQYAPNNVYYSNFSCDEDCYIYGNIMSLINKDNFATNTTLTANYTFYHLFENNPHLYNHSSKTLVLPATILTSYCYLEMFHGCTHLTTAPALPATNLSSKNYCYAGMFKGCTSLTVAPALPATTLASNCYTDMFNGCTNLTAAPALPATTLTDGCYAGMFNGCTSLTAAPALLATTLAQACYSNMFKDCTSLETAPALPAPTLVNSCYISMFFGCTNLNSVTCLATSGINTSNTSTGPWMYGVASSGTFTKAASMNDWETGYNGIPYGWTTIPVIPGKFSVSSTKQVYFSQGNLQATYDGTDWTWAFASNQWDYIGNATGNTKVKASSPFISENATVDLFGWVGASSTWTGAVQYGITNSTATYNTNGYGNVSGETLKSDWGNTIGSGWRTLTSDEWTYLFNTRTSGSTVNGTSDARYTHATINTDGTGVNGIILFPDGVTIAGSEATSWGTINGNSAWGTQCTTAQWAVLAAKGCVFLPATGYRIESTVNNAGSNGSYWSSSSTTSNVHYAYRVKISSDELGPAIEGNRCLGYSVRLVHDAN